MQFEKIRTTNKRKIIVGGVISLGVISALIYFPSRAKYRTTQEFNIVNGTINYKVPDLNIVAMYTVDENNVETSIEEVPIDDSNYTYTLNTSKSACTINGEDINASIEYNDGIVNIGITKKGTKCSVYFDKVKVPEGITSSDIIADAKTETPDFSQIADTDEGMFKVADPVYGGTSYYYRGAVTNNYVKFAGFCWRIIRINGDGSIRMIYDGATCHNNGTGTAESIALASQAYYPNYNRSEYVGYTFKEGYQRPSLGPTTTTETSSNLKTQIDRWFNANITGANVEKVAEGKFCNDRNVQSGYTWSATPSSTFYYAARGRLESAKTPSLVCDTDDIYTLKAGAITADEISFAGGVWAAANQSYYLYNGQYYWTMSPYHLASSSRYAGVFEVSGSGQLSYNYAINTTLGVRPVINLRADTIFSSGDGTIDSPFTVQ